MAAQEDFQTVYNQAYSAGFRGESLVDALAIAWAESRWYPQGDNTAGNYPPGSRDRGIMQINSYWHPEVSDACANDPVCAFKAAYTISNGGQNWNYWATWKHGQAKAAIPMIREDLSLAGLTGGDTGGYGNLAGGNGNGGGNNNIGGLIGGGGNSGLFGLPNLQIPNPLQFAMGLFGLSDVRDFLIRGAFIAAGLFLVVFGMAVLFRRQEIAIFDTAAQAGAGALADG